jgi:hypothetical protein
MLDATTLRELMYYAPHAEMFLRLKTVGRRPEQQAGFLIEGANSHGYVTIGINKGRYPAHRLAWLYVHGVWPTHELDHKNGDRGDYRITNLRDIPHRQNLQNLRGPRTDNKSGYLGVSWAKSVGKWVARIRIADRYLHLGCFDDPAVAHKAYVKAKRLHHPGFIE